MLMSLPPRSFLFFGSLTLRNALFNVRGRKIYVRLRRTHGFVTPWEGMAYLGPALGLSTPITACPERRAQDTVLGAMAFFVSVQMYLLDARLRHPVFPNPRGGYGIILTRASRASTFYTR